MQSPTGGVSAPYDALPNILWTLIFNNLAKMERVPIRGWVVFYVGYFSN
jgi:hypothetical protein